LTGPGACAWRRHGGNSPPGAIDFSAPANPLGPPPGLAELIMSCASSRVYLSYPSPGLQSRLASAASEYLNVDEDHIVLSNGSAELLSLIPLALKARSLVVVEPNFGDHELLARSVGVDLLRVLMPAVDDSFQVTTDDIIRVARAARSPAVLIMSRPNNPTGYLADERLIDDISSRLPRDVTLVVDEAFIGLSSLGTSLGDREDLITLRSFTKDLAAPGLRLGAMVTSNRAALRAVSGSMQAWPVDSITACSLSSLLSDRSVRDHVRRGKDLVARELPRVSEGLRSAGFKTFRSAAPFVLVKHRRPNPDLKDALLEHGIYIRDASSFYSLDRHYSRISIRSPRDNDVLLSAARSIGP